MIGDIITQIGDDFISGLPTFEAFHKCFGPVGSEVEIVASRMLNGVKGRVSDLVVRDQEAPAMKAHLGIACKQVPTGMQVTKIFPDTSAAESGLKEKDVITIADEDFLAGLKVVCSFYSCDGARTRHPFS